MPGVPGYLTSVKIGGTPVALSDEPMVDVGGSPNLIFRVTDATKRILDPAATFVFGSGAGSPTAIPAADVASINYLAGTVTFSVSPTLPVVIQSGNYIPVSFIAGAHTYGLSCSSDLLDNTTFESAKTSTQRQKQVGLLDVSVSVDRFDEGDLTIKTFLENRTRVLIDITPGSGTLVARGWFVPESENRQGAIAELESAPLVFQLDGDDKVDFDFIETA